MFNRVSNIGNFLEFIFSQRFPLERATIVMAFRQLSVGAFRRKTHTIVVTFFFFFKTNELTDFISFIS